MAKWSETTSVDKGLKSPEHVDREMAWKRNFTLGSAIFSGLVWSITQFYSQGLAGLDPASLAWIAAISGKMALLLTALWVGFPAIVALQRFRGSSTIMVGLVAIAGLFLVNPRLLRFALPIVVVAIMVMVGLEWFAKRRRK